MPDRLIDAGADPLASAVEELYSHDPAGFVDRRDELATAARADGDAAAAKAIGALRRPTRSAWLVNRFARADPDLIDDLIEVGDELRAAQNSLDGVQLRELTARRRQVISAAVRAASRGEQVTESVRAEVTSTLEAALADPDLAAQVAAGALARPIDWSGFGAISVGTGLSVVPDAARSERTAAERPAAQARAATNRPAAQARAAMKGPAAQARAATEQAANEQAAEQAAERLSAWREQVAEAQADVEAARAVVSEADGRRTQARQRIEQIESALAQARLDQRSAGTQHRRAQTRVAEAERRLKRLQSEQP